MFSPAHLRILQALVEGPGTPVDVAKRADISYRRTAEVVKELEELRFVERADDTIQLGVAPHAALVLKLGRRYDLHKLLGGPRQGLLLTLLEPKTRLDLQRLHNFSYWRLRRHLKTLYELGVVDEANGRLTVIHEYSLRLYLQAVQELLRRRSVEPAAEVLFERGPVRIKRLPHGLAAVGSPTGFSVFPRHGVEVFAEADYYVEPPQEVTAEQALLHALAVSATSAERTLCAVFYTVKRTILDLTALRAGARQLGILPMWLDLERYIRQVPLDNPQAFLPWAEFASKLQVYGIKPQSLLVSPPYPDFFETLAGVLEDKLDLHVFGGEVMRLRALKAATKDIDLVVKSSHEFDVLATALARLNYRPMGKQLLSDADRRLKPSAIFTHPTAPRIDVFTRVICNAFQLSRGMVARAEPRVFGALTVHFLANEDLLLLKAITEREGDLADMQLLATTPGFNWKVVWEELLTQERKTRRHFCHHLLDSMEALEARARIHPPIYRQLSAHALDYALLQAVVRFGARTVREISEYAKFPLPHLRTRLERLVQTRRLRKQKRARSVLYFPA